MIHSTAIIHSKAEIDSTVEVGPYCIIDQGVVVGPRCKLGPHVQLTGNTVIGEHNVFHFGCVIGDEPQDLKYHGEPTRVTIGDSNVFREYVTVHRATKMTEETIIGSHNYLMANSHVGHNAHLGNYILIANGALLAGHVSVDDQAFISGNCLAHQFVRIGTLALMQGGAAISKDLPPYTIARGDNFICGLNAVGLRRAGFTSDERTGLKRLYHVLFRKRMRLHDALESARKEFSGEHAEIMFRFIEGSKRGVCADIGLRHHHRGQV